MLLINWVNKDAIDLTSRLLDGRSVSDKLFLKDEIRKVLYKPVLVTEVTDPLNHPEKIYNPSKF